MEKCYKVDFTARLSKITLAFKMECLMWLAWKRGIIYS